MPGLASLASASFAGQGDTQRKAYLIELDANDRPAAAFEFQYFPESISDSKSVNYQQKEIPGGSLPLYQWIASGERLVSFTATFSTDVDLRSDPKDGTSVKSQGLVNRLKSSGVAKRNADLRSAVAWLRRYMLPTYSGSEYRATTAPSKLRLSLPGSGIGVAGGVVRGSVLDDTIICVMTQCEVNYEAFFPSGLPRYATVQLAFAQIPQLNGVVVFPSRTDEFDNYVTKPTTTALGYDFGVQDSQLGSWKKAT